VRTGKELIWATRPFAAEVRWRSAAYTLSTLAMLVLFSAGSLWNIHPVARIVSSVCSALLLVRMFVIYHDYQHRAILRKSLWARMLFTAFGLYVLAPSSIWKHSHDYHHSHNSKLSNPSVGSYPIHTPQEFLQASRSRRLAYLAVRHPLTIAGAYVTHFLYSMCLRAFLSSPRRHSDSLLALLLHAALAVAVTTLFGWDALLLLLVLPFTIACAFGAYLFYAQHNFPGATFKGGIEWSYEHAALESSSHLVMHPFWRWVTANIGYHHIHHLNARIPFYRLPEAMEHIPELRAAKTTTLHPVEIYRCLLLKLWDPGTMRMIPMTHGLRRARGAASCSEPRRLEAEVQAAVDGSDRRQPRMPARSAARRRSSRGTR